MSYLIKDFLEWGLLILFCFLLVVIELINSFIEKVVDFISKEFYFLVKKVKDMVSLV